MLGVRISLSPRKFCLGVLTIIELFFFNILWVYFSIPTESYTYYLETVTKIHLDVLCGEYHFYVIAESDEKLIFPLFRSI